MCEARGGESENDPLGRGWVVDISDARDGPDGREYRVNWFVWQGTTADYLSRFAPVKELDTFTCLRPVMAHVIRGCAEPEGAAVATPLSANLSTSCSPFATPC